MSLRKLDEQACGQLRSEFEGCQAFRNIDQRFGVLLADPVWAIQDDYRVWDASDFTSFNGVPVLHSPSKAARLFIGERAGGDWQIHASVVLHRRQRGVFGHLPVNVGRTTIVDPMAFLGESAFLLRAPYQFLVPLAGHGVHRCFTFPFAQQDSENHRCIDVSLWQGTDYLHRRFGTARVPINVLRPAVMRARHHLVPAPGLYPEEVVEALHLSGLAPVHYQMDAGTRRNSSKSDPLEDQFWALHGTRGARVVSPLLFQEVLHAYLDSQFPVFLVIHRLPRRYEGERCVGLVEGVIPEPHSLCVVGHTAYVGGDQPAPQAAEIRNYRRDLGFITTTTYIRDLVVHDDDVGPFLLLPMRVPVGPPDLTPNRLWFESVAHSATSLFVGLPPEVRMPAEDALYIVQGVLKGDEWTDLYSVGVRRHLGLEPVSVSVDEEDIRAVLEAPPGGMGVGGDDRMSEVAGLVGLFAAARERQELVVSLYLEHSSRLRRLAMEDPDLPHASRELYLDLPLPKYLWVAEIMTPQLMSQAAGKPKVLGELLIDPSQSKYPWSVLSLRFPGVHIYRAGPGGLLENIPSVGGLRVQWTLRNFERPDQIGTRAPAGAPEGTLL